MKTFKNKDMKITNKHTGYSFNLSEKQTANFFYTKNAKGEYINSSEDYTIENESDISDTRHYITCIGLFLLMVASGLLHIQWNY